MVIVDAFTHYLALKPGPHCNSYYAYTTLYEHWIAKFGQPKKLVTDNGTEFINNEIITLCHLYNIKHKPRTSHAPWTNELVEGMNRSLQEYLRCIINGNDTRYTECLADVKLFPLSYKSQQLYQKITKKLLKRQNINNQINSRFMAATDLKIGIFILIPNFNTQKGISKKLQPLRKGPYQIVDKPTEVTYKLTDSSKKEIVQYCNNLLTYYPKEYALRELTQLYSFTVLHIVQNNPQTDQNQNVNTNKNQKNNPTAKRKPSNIKHARTQKERKNRKMTKKILPQDQQQKFEHRESSRLRSQPQKNYKTFIPQSKN